MIIRIVKMKFQAGSVDTFLALFEEIREDISGFDGCQHVKLLQDRHDPTVFFTYSKWDSESHLNAYRHSAFFDATWKKTKALFDARPEAWSLDHAG